MLEEALGDKCQVKLVEIPSGDKQEDINSFLKAVSAAISADVDLTLDVTHGFRHFSFLTYIGALIVACQIGMRRVHSSICVHFWNCRAGSMLSRNSTAFLMSQV